ncbi:MAG: potassium channel family protein, partial [Candidatus Poribacteria bacterium]
INWLTTNPDLLIDKVVLIASLSCDKDNLFVVLSARELNPDLRIVSKAVEEGAFQKIRKAGADDIIFPDAIGGLRMASSMLRPNVVNFLDVMLKHQDETTRFSEVTIGKDSEFIDSTLMDAKIFERTELLVVALRRAGENKFIYNPKPATQLKAGDILIVIGDINQIQKLQKLAKDPTM